MSFTSAEYVVLLVFSLCAYWAVKSNERARILVLLISSLIFYGFWSAPFLILLLATCSVDYFSALGIERHRGTSKARVFLIFAIVLNLTVLGVFKYYDFFVDTAKDVLASFGFNVSLVRLDLILPIGISFYTFHAISYVIDVFRGVLPATRSYSFYITYVIFFPQLVAGPIMRARPMIEQFKAPVFFSYDYAVSGLRLILLGLIKKVLLADNLGIYVDPIYGNVSAHNGSEIALATLCFGMQIYLDFSAYSEIAKGSARLFGIELCDNFQFPYLAENIQDFWRRWHISLTTWFRDYLYKPLGGSRTDLASTLINVGIVFVASGLWHGANLTFLAWGATHAAGYIFFLCIVAARRRFGWQKSRSIPARILAWLMTFLFVMCSWVWFRSPDIASAQTAFNKMVHLRSEEIAGLPLWPILLTVAVLGAELIWQNRDFAKSSWMLRWTAYVVAAVTVLIFGATDDTRFIYFQF